MKSGRTRKIALALPLGLAYVERLLQGILGYAREHHTNWVFTRLPEQVNPSCAWLRNWNGDGAFVHITSKAEAGLAASLDIPVVNITSYVRDGRVPTIMVDHREIGRLAAQHLLEQRFRRFGFYGTYGMLFSELRRESFVETVVAAGGSCRVLEVSPTVVPDGRWRRRAEELGAWLKTLKPPVGIMASTDLRAGMVADACSVLGLRVPEDVAIIGVDNDPVACEFSRPQLSSVSRNEFQVGWQAASLLARLLKGAPAPGKPVLVPPDGVVQRRSTQTLAVDDPCVAAAVQYIREHLNESFGVERILAMGALSRRRLENRFKESVGCTPYVLINQLRVRRAQSLLARPGRQTLTSVALACGFSGLRRFTLVFQRLTGQTPAQFRKLSTASARVAGVKIPPHGC